MAYRSEEELKFHTNKRHGGAGFTQMTYIENFFRSIEIIFIYFYFFSVRVVQFHRIIRKTLRIEVGTAQPKVSTGRKHQWTRQQTNRPATIRWSFPTCPATINTRRMASLASTM